MTKRFLLLVLCVFFLAFVLRFFQLTSIPSGLYQDETALGYNAFSILQTGKDEHGKQYPVYFESFGDYKLPVYVYLTAASMKLFGVNEFAVRFPSAFFGLLTVLLLFFLVFQVTHKKYIALLACFLLAINPWHLHFSRAGFEVNLSLFFAVLGSLLLLKATNKAFIVSLFTLSFLSFFLSAYSYNVSRVFSPALFIVLSFFLLVETKQIRKYALYPVVGAIIFCVSFFLLSQNVSGGGTQSNLVGGGQSLANALEIRSYTTALPSLLAKVFFSKWIVFGHEYIGNMISFLSPAFYFVSGSTHGNHGIGNAGLSYLFESVTVFFGIVASIKTKNLLSKFVGLWFIITLIIVSLSHEAPHATRGFFLVIPLVIFSAQGIMYLFEKRSVIYSTMLQKVFLTIVVLFSTTVVIHYFASYYLRFPVVYAQAWRSEDKELAVYLKEQEKKYDRVIIDPSANLIYTSLLFYQRVSPQMIQKTAVREKKNKIGYYGIEKIGKYEFREIISDDLNVENVLLVVGSNKKLEDMKLLQEFKYPNRPVVLYVNGSIAQYPREDIAYRVYAVE